MVKPDLKTLIDTLPQVGKVEWIGIRPEKRTNLAVVEEAEALEGKGLAGDHYQANDEGF
jgi:hypothetical protein